MPNLFENTLADVRGAGAGEPAVAVLAHGIANRIEANAGNPDAMRALAADLRSNADSLGTAVMSAADPNATTRGKGATGAQPGNMGVTGSTKGRNTTDGEEPTMGTDGKPLNKGPAAPVAGGKVDANGRPIVADIDGEAAAGASRR